MGQFIINVDAVGGHGCERNRKDGEQVFGCQFMGCPDCIAREFVATLIRKGVMVNSATLTHWPGTEGQVVDDLLTKVRKGNF